jgi:N-acetyl-anhydromuramyl-L-alanine amidase AmpD
MFETDNWPFIPAKFFTPVSGKRKVRLIVIHAMQAPEKGETAENVGRYFQTIPRPASAHIGVDSNSIVQYVADNDVAYAAPGVNKDGIHIELAGYAAQSNQEWLDEYGQAMLDRAANATAQYCLKYDIPCVRLSLKELKDGKRGVIGHFDATQTYKPNAGHTDPGKDFPWDWFIKRANEHLAKLRFVP